MDASADAARRLNADESFEGWDITPACFATDYLIMAVGITCALLTWRQYGKSWPSLEALSASCALFCLLEGLCFGFGGIAHHLLATYHDEGLHMSRIWFHAQAEWMLSWTVAMFLGPLTSAVCLCTAFAFSEIGVAWIRGAKVVGFFVALFELYLCSCTIDASGTASLYWALFCALVGCGVLFKRGTDVPGLILCVIGYSCRIVGYLVVITAPDACRTSTHLTAVHTETGTLYRKTTVSGCWYPPEFNQTAVFHMLVAFSIVFIYFGVMAKLDKDRESAYLQMMRSSAQKDQPGCCGLGGLGSY